MENKEFEKILAGAKENGEKIIELTNELSNSDISNISDEQFEELTDSAKLLEYELTRLEKNIKK